MTSARLPPLGAAAAPSMTTLQRHRLAELLQRSCGFVWREHQQVVAERRLTTRLAVLGLADFDAYARFLEFDPQGGEELRRAVGLLVPHETYFFREPAQLACFETEVVPRLVKQRADCRTLRLWSAGCATGEEPYTLAMLLSGRPDLEGWTVEVLGTDWSSQSLATAERGEYRPTSLRATSQEQRERFFEPLAGGRVLVKEAVRAVVSFRQLNLLEPEATAPLPRFDAIFCRNVLMYFDVPTRVRVVERLFDRLESGGFLLLGQAENLLTLATRFEPVQFEGGLVYRRPLTRATGQ